MTTTTIPSRWMITSADAADDPDVFPYMAGRSFLPLKTPLWSTDVKTAVSGKERRRALWSYPIWKFKVSFNVLRDMPAAPDLMRLYAFFNSHAGQAEEFFFLDRTDHEVSAQQFGTGDGTTTTFQLKRTITVGSITCAEPVLAPIWPFAITINGTPTTAFTLGAYGRVTFTSPPAAGAQLRWTGQFFFVCRFGADEMDVEQLMSGLWAGQAIEFQSVKP